MVERRIPRWADIEPLLRLRAPGFGDRHRLASAASIWDLRRIARRRTPQAVFDYTDGAAGEEITMDRSRAAYRSVAWSDITVLRDVSEVDTATSLLGVPSPLPLALAPTGFTRMMHHAGEQAVARAAERAGLTYALSTLGTTTPEDVAAAAPDLNRWFQLYLFKDRGFSAELLERADTAGYSAVMLTVDTAVAGNRRRDIRNGLTIPPSLTLKTLADMALHPAWWFNLLTTEPLEFATFRNFDGTVAELVTQVFDPHLNWSDVRWIRNHWSGPVVIKGIQRAEDARTAVDEGIEAIVVSNHGGRQLDRAPATFDLIPEITDAVGDGLEVYVDGGLMEGADVVAAVARGARAAFIGRAYLYGLMAGGEHGVERAIGMLEADIVRTMQLLGVTSLAELRPEHLVTHSP